MKYKNYKIIFIVNIKELFKINRLLKSNILFIYE